MGELIRSGANVTPVAPLVLDDPSLLEAALPSARVSFEKSKVPEFGGIPPLNQKWSPRAPQSFPQVGIGKGRMGNIQESEREGYSRYKQALDRRNNLIADYLMENPEVNAAFMEASSTGDLATKGDIESAIIERLGEAYGDINEYEVEPRRYEVKKSVTEAPSHFAGAGAAPAIRTITEEYPMSTTQDHLKELGGKVLIKDPTVASLMSPSEEKLYQYISEGILFNPSAKPTKKGKDGKIVDNPDYLDDDTLLWYAGALTQRTTDYSKHKHYHPLRQRMGEWLASKGYSTKGIKARELGRGIIPFQEDWERHLTDPKEREEREKVRGVMNLMDENAEGHHMAGKVLGLLGTAGVGYAGLTAKGLTTFLGANARTTQSLLATGAAEIGIDAAYNPDGYSMVLGSMLNVEEGRLVSGLEAVALGTAFNLGIDMVRLIKGSRMKDVGDILHREGVIDKQKIHHLQEKARLANKKGNTATAKETANAPVPNIEVKPLAASPETNLRINDMLAEGEKLRLVKLNEIESVLDNVTTLPNVVRKQLEGQARALRQSQPLLSPDATRAARGDAAEVMTREELMKSLDTPALIKFSTTPANAKLLSDLAHDFVLDIKMPSGSKAWESAEKEIWSKAGNVSEFTDELLNYTTPLRPTRSIEQVKGKVLMEMDAKGVEFLNYAEDWAKSPLRESGREPMSAGFVQMLQRLRKQINAPTSSVPSPATAEDAMKMLGNVMPERNAVNMEKLIKEAKEGAPYVKEGFTRQAAREALRREVMPAFGLSMFGGGAGLTMSRDEKEVWGNVMAGAMLPIAPKGLKALARGFSKNAGYVATPLVSTLHRIDPDIAWGVHKQQVKVQINTHSRLERTMPFLTEMNDLVARRVITEAEKKRIYDLLQDGKKVAAIARIRQIDGSAAMGSNHRGYLTAMFDEHEKVFREMGAEAEDIGYGMGNLGDTYFPRSVKDHDGMMEKIYDLAEGDDRVTRAWAAAEDRAGRPLTLEEQAHFANEVFSHSGFGRVAGRPSHASTRKFDEIPDELRGFYHDYEHSASRYVQSMTDSFESHKFLGKGVDAHWLRKIVEVDPGVKDAITELRLTNPQRLEGTIGEMFPDAWSRLSKDLHKRQLVVSRLNDFYNKPIGRAMGSVGKTMRDLSYMATIGNPYSTLTQMSDILLSASLNSHGMGGSVFANIAKSKKNLTYSLADWGLDAKGVQRLALEFEDMQKSTKWLEKNLQTTGFMAVDRHSKRVLVNAAFDDFRKAANADMSTKSGRSAFKQLEREFEGMGSEDFAEMVQVLRGDPRLAKSNFDVQAAVLSRLWKQHPINKAHMPLGYVKHPKGRLWYMLKTFTIKQIDLLRRSTLDEINAGAKAKDWGRAGRGTLNLFKYAGYFGISQQGINAVKDFILGREVSMSDRVVSLAAQSMGLHRMYFHMFRDTFDPKNASSFSTNLKDMGANFFTPTPVAIIIDTIMPDAFDSYNRVTSDNDQDIFQSYGEDYRLFGVETPIPDSMIPWAKGRGWRYLPWLGKDLYWSIGAGRDIEEARHPEMGSAKRKAPTLESIYNTPEKFYGR